MWNDSILRLKATHSYSVMWRLPLHGIVSTAENIQQRTCAGELSWTEFTSDEFQRRWILCSSYFGKYRLIIATLLMTQSRSFIIYSSNKAQYCVWGSLWTWATLNGFDSIQRIELSISLNIIGWIIPNAGNTCAVVTMRAVEEIVKTDYYEDTREAGVQYQQFRIIIMTQHHTNLAFYCNRNCDIIVNAPYFDIFTHRHRPRNMYIVL